MAWYDEAVFITFIHWDLREPLNRTTTVSLFTA